MAIICQVYINECQLDLCTSSNLEKIRIELELSKTKLLGTVHLLASKNLAHYIFILGKEC